MKSPISKRLFPDFTWSGGDPPVTAQAVSPLGSQHIPSSRGRFQHWSWMRPCQSQPFLQPHASLAGVHPGPNSELSFLLGSEPGQPIPPLLPHPKGPNTVSNTCPGVPYSTREQCPSHLQLFQQKSPRHPCCKLCPKILSPISPLGFFVQVQTRS